MFITGKCYKARKQIKAKIEKKHKFGSRKQEYVHVRHKAQVHKQTIKTGRKGTGAGHVQEGTTQEGIAFKIHLSIFTSLSLSPDQGCRVCWSPTDIRQEEGIQPGEIGSPSQGTKTIQSHTHALKLSMLGV